MLTSNFYILWNINVNQQFLYTMYKELNFNVSTELAHKCKSSRLSVLFSFQRSLS